MSHHYGKEGRDSKQIESSGLLFDFEFFQTITSNEFIDALRSSIKEFVDHINTNLDSSGIKLKCYVFFGIQDLH